MPEISGWVMAGGKSSRMGQNKALMEYNGKTLLAHAIEKLKMVAEDVSICGGGQALATGAIPMIEDRFQCGPLGGIVSALEASKSNWNFVLPVDMPLIPAAWLKTLALVAQTSTAKAIVSRSQGQAQPLVAAYHRDLTQALKVGILHQNYKVMSVLTSVTEVAYLDTADGASFVNVNTPEEYAALPLQSSRGEVVS